MTFIDLKAGDIATENYEQVELTLSGNITAADGAEITQRLVRLLMLKVQIV